MNPFLHTLLGGRYPENRFNANKSAEITAINSTIGRTNNHTVARIEKLSDMEIRRANFIWPEDPADELPVK